MWPFALLYANTYGVVFPVVSTLAFCYVSFNVFKWMIGDATVPIPSVNNRHNWKNVRITAKVFVTS